MNIGFSRLLDELDTMPVHTGMKPLRENRYFGLPEFVVANSSWNTKRFAHLFADHTWIKRKLNYESLYAAREKEVELEINPVLNFELGRDVGRNDAINMYKNTRGFTANVHITKKFSMSTSFYENQMRVQTYLMEIAQNRGPARVNAAGNLIRDKGYANFFGQGRTKPFGTSGYDFAMATGYVSFSPMEKLNIQFGTDKLFIGHGYRSLLLSDNSFVYPMLKTNVQFLENKLNYTLVYASMQSLTRLPVFTTPEATFERKALAMHYVSYLVNKRLEIGLMEATVWQRMQNWQQKSFDYSFLNPLPLINTLRFGFDGTNNTLIGLQAKYKLKNKLNVYAQLLLDGFQNTINCGYQLGALWNNPAGIKNWQIRGEYNYVTPYTYTSKTKLQNYAHYNMPLAHPWGAGFNEWILLLNWRKDDFFLENKWIYGNFKTIGGKEYGKDLFLASEDPAINLAPVFSQIVYADIKFGYVINPITNLRLSIGLTNYYRFNGKERNNSNYVYLGLSTSLTNIYLDI